MASTSRSGYDPPTRELVAIGVSTFAGVLMATVAVFQILQGIAAIAKDDVFITGQDYQFKLDVSTWGWIHLVIGIIALVAGAGILAGQTWGRLVGIFIAFLAILSNFAFIPYYPIWSVVVIAFWIATLWALCTQLSED
ncbi:hypothetical protein [Nocardioides sp. CER19]|uniref:DUF7144 family membrane protein n=1 Tax=Nocardioides sp. CER19 TaxID=3038538 RepID=UPI00244BB81B|nr:hypothetical protein [Nocardioides sp. CER19]MDH2416008.1 hypothetical protein [Nocardioides sp. CER19]